MARAVDHIGVNGQKLAGAAARQHLGQRGIVVQVFNDLLYADDCHMHPGQARHHAAIAFVGHQAHAACLRDDEVRARNPHLSRQEVVAHHLAGKSHHCAGILQRRHAQFFLKNAPNFLL